MSSEQAELLRQRLGEPLRKLLDQETHPLHFDAALLGACLRERRALPVVRRLAAAGGRPEPLRLRALEALVAVRDEGILDVASGVLAGNKGNSAAFRGQVLGVLGKLDDPKVAALVLENYGRLEPDVQPRAVEVLTQRPAWGKDLLRAVAAKKVPASALNVNQVRRLLSAKDPEVAKLVKEQWGTVREGRSPEREKVVAQMGVFLRRTPGDAKAGVLVFRNLCGQCHKIHGEGQDVGPDLTGNGRASFEQLLSNVFDPSLVIGASYQATTVLTASGRSLTGLLVEDSPRRVVLKMQGGKLETVPRGEVEEISVSPVSLMPEGVEKQLKAQELADLFAFLALDRPPGDPAAKKIPGAP